MAAHYVSAKAELDDGNAARPTGIFGIWCAVTSGRTPPMLSATRRIAACSILFGLVSVSAAHAQDTVTTATGEKIVGEIKSVEKDIVTIETPYSDSDFKIK